MERERGGRGRESRERRERERGGKGGRGRERREREMEHLT